MSGGGPIRIPSTMMPRPALNDLHDDSDIVGTLLRQQSGRALSPRIRGQTNQPEGWETVKNTEIPRARVGELQTIAGSSSDKGQAPNHIYYILLR